ncbi:probable polyol transporter 6 [Prosopis cineraria]|uniref:probable polyol transporter 6 n=1 Tax=Prosopis cineraria TaxID=364024 RepID=UPI00240F0354|nr:probable polyol transporter 6 [Prosopis cineraria]
MCKGKEEANEHCQVNGIEAKWESSESEKVNKYAFACVLAASVVSTMVGYAIGVMAGALLYIKEELKISDIQVELLVGALSACAIPGTMAAGRISDFIGRRYTFILCSIMYFVGSILGGYGPSYAVLFTGRCITGIGVGFALNVVSVYCVEISPPAHRGFLTSLPDLSIILAILLSFVSNYYFGKLSLKLGWRIMLGLPSIPSLAVAVLMLKLVESPRWLVMQGRLAESEQALLLLSNTREEAERRLQDIKIAAGNCNQFPNKTRRGEEALKELFCKPSSCVRRILIIAMAVHMFQQMSGIEGILLYSPRIFERTGITHKSKIHLATLGIGITQFIFTGLATFLMDRVGRRALLLVSSGGAAMALLGSGICMTIVESTKEKLVWAPSFVIAATYLFVTFIQVGMGPATWVYSSEIFPLRLRAQGHAIGVVVNRTMSVVVITTFISIYKKITMGGTLFVLGGINALAWLFYFFFLRETKGRSLEDIETIFGQDYYKSPQKKSKPADRCNANNDA